MKNLLVGCVIATTALVALVPTPAAMSTPIDADDIAYEAVLTDPKVYTRPWTMALRFPRMKDCGPELWEEACHENNERTLEMMLQRPGR